MDSDLLCEVCIIGSNISGSYLAYLLANHGINVIVVEQNRIPGIPLQCAGIVSQRLTNIVDVDPSIIINRVDTAWLYLENGKKISVSIRDNPYILDRIKLDQHFYQKAEDAGAKFLLHEKFLNFTKTHSSIDIITNRRIIKAKLLVGCDGPNSRVAKMHGIKHNLIPAIQVRAMFDHSNNSVEMHFKEKWKNLFGWVIPEGNGICRIGLGCQNKLKQSFQSYLKELKVDNSRIIDKNGGQIIIGYPQKIAFHRVILLGDAAGMVKATTGGGINTLLKASTYAMRAILKAISKNKFSQRFLITHYENSKGIRFLKRNIFLHYLVRVLLIHLSQSDYEEGMLFLNQPKTKKLLLKYGDMDFPLKFVRVDLWRYIPNLILSIFKKLPNIIRYLGYKFLNW
jgi:digeranylgeranylglycerophospholipid reductase